MTALRVLAVDDEAPALDELAYLLGEHPAVGEVVRASDATEALRLLSERSVAAAFLDISMPGLSGMELAAVLARYAQPPALVFVTAHSDRAVAAFDVGAVDYLLKPVRAERLSQAIERVLAVRGEQSESAYDDSDGELPGAVPATAESADEPDTGVATGDVIPVERGGVTSLIPRESVAWVEAVGDYARLHTATGDYLVRVTLATLESHWARSGFARVHRSYLVSLPMVSGLRSVGTATKVIVRGIGETPEVELPVSRRQVRDLKDRLVRDPLRSFRTRRGDGAAPDSR